MAISDIKMLIQLHFYLKESLDSKTRVPELRSISPLKKEKATHCQIFSYLITFSKASNHMLQD